VQGGPQHEQVEALGAVEHAVHRADEVGRVDGHREAVLVAGDAGPVHPVDEGRDVVDLEQGDTRVDCRAQQVGLRGARRDGDRRDGGARRTARAQRHAH